METKTTKIAQVILKRNGIFSLDQVVKETHLDRCEACHILEKLFLEKIIRRISSQKVDHFYERRGRPFHLIKYRLSDRKALELKISPKLKPDTAQDRMWKIIRYLRTFKIRDLIQLGKVQRENARWFVKMLRRAGYIQPSKPRGQGVEWRLIKDSGPKRPYITAYRRKGGKK